jgi:hypothetical protein
LLLFLFSFALGSTPTSADTQLWRVDEGVSFLTFRDDNLVPLGLILEDVRETASSERLSHAPAIGRQRSFRVQSGSTLSFSIENGTLAVADDARLRHQGGFFLSVESGQLSRTAVFDFAVDFAPSHEHPILARIRAVDSTLPHPLEVRNTGGRNGTVAPTLPGGGSESSICASTPRS